MQTPVQVPRINRVRTLQLSITAIAFAAFLWWFSTGVIFYLNARPPHTFRWSMFGGSLLLLGALAGLWASASVESVGAVFVAFTCGLLIWGWHTMSYYMGVITGPRRDSCPPQAQGLQRFGYALATSIYHELAIVATAGLMLWLTWDQPNLTGLWTFVLLWAMHVSAKLNVFLGVRNLNVEFIPKRLGYLSTYFRHRAMNLLFPFSVTGGTIITVLLIQQASQAEPGSASGVAFVLLATLMALAVIEHWFMILPIRAEALWQWSLKAAGTGPTQDPGALPGSRTSAKSQESSIILPR